LLCISISAFDRAAMCGIAAALAPAVAARALPRNRIVRKIVFAAAGEAREEGSAARDAGLRSLRSIGFAGCRAAPE